MVNHHFAKFSGHRRSGSVDIMFLVAKEENSKCSRFNPPLLFNLQGISYYPGHTRSKEQSDKYWKITFLSSSKILSRRRKRKRR